MVNSLPRLFAEMIDTLDRVGENVTDPYLRSQVISVIDVLTNMAHRVEWKRSDVLATVNDLRALFADIVTLLERNGSCPAALHPLSAQLTTAATTPLDEDLIAERERLSRLLITAMQELATARTQMAVPVADAIDQQCNAYLRRQLDRDLALVRRPLFRRVSQG